VTAEPRDSKEQKQTKDRKRSHRAMWKAEEEANEGLKKGKEMM